MTTTDRIQKQVMLKAPRSRVWRALTDHHEFGAWFGVTLAGPFVEGKGVHGVFNEGSLTQEGIDAYAREIGLKPAPIKMPPPEQVFCTVERMEPERRFAFRWVPYGIDASIDWKTEPTTLVEFVLEEHSGGTQLTVVESGFDKVPAHRRERAFRMNTGGWDGKAEDLANYVKAA